MASNVLKVQLSNGLQMPMIGLGTYARKSTPGQYREAVEHAIDIGYRHIDTAACYNNEEEVGEGINGKINAGLVKRDNLFVTTKLWNDSHAEKDVIPALKQSLARLKLDYVDLYLIHWPVSVNSAGVDTGIDYVETWRGMEEALRQGLTKGIGVSNFNEEQLDRLLRNCTTKPLVNQFEINPTLTQQPLSSYCRRQSVVPVAYTPLGLISEARPEFVGKDDIKTDPRLGELATKYGKTRAQIALRYLIQRGIPALPKSFTPSRIAENISIFDFTLSEQDMQVVESYNIDHRCVPGTAFKEFKYYPF